MPIAVEIGLEGVIFTPDAENFPNQQKLKHLHINDTLALKRENSAIQSTN